MSDGGVLETVSNAISLDGLKKAHEENGKEWESLARYFQLAFPATRSQQGMDTPWVSYDVAITNYIRSLAGYSIACYVLAIRDRHNANILIDDEGHILHIDFGFMLSGAPGGKVMQQLGGFELSKGFKLTSELAEVIGWHDNPELFEVFRESVVEGLVAVRQDHNELLALLQLAMLGSENHGMACFQHPRGYPEAILEDIRERLGFPRGGLDNGHGPGINGHGQGMTDHEFKSFVGTLVDISVDHWRSRAYDAYQRYFTNIH